MTRTPFISAIGSLAAVSAIAAAILAAPAPARAQAAFNGTWSVLIVTQSGSCDRAYRYPLRVNNGQVTYAGQADFDVSGQVRRDGAVKSPSAAATSAPPASGRLGGDSGSGTWQGAGSASTCSGTWTAEKRG